MICYGANHIAQWQTSKETIAGANVRVQCEWTLTLIVNKRSRVHAIRVVFTSGLSSFNGDCTGEGIFLIQSLYLEYFNTSF